LRTRRALSALNVRRLISEWENRNFLDLVNEGRLPQPVRIDGVTTWCRHDLDAAYDQLKADETERRSNPIEEHYGIGAEQ
jgi:hypothetical protein